MTQHLPKTLLDLIEHVELNKSGWWDAALRNVLLAAVWMHGKPVGRRQVQELVVSAFSLEIPEDRIAVGIDWLVREGRIKVHENDHITPTSSVVDQLEARLKAAQLNEDTVRSSFFNKVGNCCAPHSPEETWNLFIERYFLPLIDVLGVRTLQFMGGDEAGGEDVAALTDGFVRLFEGSNRKELRSAIGGFLDPEDPNVRRYVTEHLDASFLVRASGLTSEAIAGFSEFGRKSPRFRLFLDTNFLFSLLDLHDNPSNEAAQMLGQTIQQVGKHLSIRMNVILPTVDEIKRTLQASRANLTGMRMSPELANAALDVGISGIAMRFVRANRESVRPISAHDYFEPFLKDLTPILRSRGIEIYNANTSEYRQRQDVIDDLLAMVNIEGQPESERQRRYNAALHDSILWHFVQDKRPSVFESPLEAEFWVVTNDYRLINFDRKRRRVENSAAEICIHPAELVQMLRLWEPRSSKMEQALMSGLRLPFMFYEYDSGKEAASIRVLKALSRFEHISHLGPEAIRDIVLSDAVRSKTVTAISEEEENAVIRDALLAEREEIVDQRDVAVRRANQVEEALVSERQAALGSVTANVEKMEQAEGRLAALEAELQEAREETCNRGEQVKTLEALLAEKDVHNRVRSARFRATLTRGIAGGILTAVTAVGLGYGWIMLRETSSWIVSLTMFSAWAVGWFLILTGRVHDTDVREWAPMRMLINVRRQAKLVISAIVITVIANVIWQVLIWPHLSG